MGTHIRSFRARLRVVCAAGLVIVTGMAVAWADDTPAGAAQTGDAVKAEDVCTVCSARKQSMQRIHRARTEKAAAESATAEIDSDDSMPEAPAPAAASGG